MALLGSLIAGGAFAILFALRHGHLRVMLANVMRMMHLGGIAVAVGIPVRFAATGWISVGKLPFAVPIAVGTITTVVATHFGFL